MGETEPKDRERSEESGPEQGGSSSPPPPAWPSAEAEAWPDDDTDQPASPPEPAPIRDESHVRDDEPHVTPSGEPEWPSEEPGPTAELPIPDTAPERAAESGAAGSDAEEIAAAEKQDGAEPEPEPDEPRAEDGPADSPVESPEVERDRTEADARPEPDGQVTAALPVEARREESPEDTSAEDARPGSTRPEDTRSGDTRPGGVRSEDTRSGDTRPGGARSEDTRAGDTHPGDTRPGGAHPGDTRSGGAHPGDTRAGDTHPGGALPGSAPSEDTHPGLPAVSTDRESTQPTSRPPSRLPRRAPVGPPPGGPRKPPVHARPYRPGSGPPPADGSSAGRQAEATRVVRPVAPPESAEQTRIVRPVQPPEPARQSPVARPSVDRTRTVRPPESPAERTTVVRAPGDRGEPGRRDNPVERRPPGSAEQTSIVRTAPREDPKQDKADKTDGADEVAEARPRRRTGLIVGIAVAAVLALAAGVVFGVPGVAERLGLRGEEPVAIAPPPAPVVFAPELAPPGEAAPAPTADGVAGALAGPASAAGLGTFTGVVVDPMSGETLYSAGADTARVPASTTKILSGAAALLALPHTEQLVTKVVRGDEPGTVVIVGGGDPTLSSLPVGKDSVYPGAAHLDDLVEQVKASGPVDTVLIDIGRYAADDFAPGWERVDIAAGHITPIVPGMLDGGRSDPTAATTPRSANPARALAEAFAQRVGARVPASAATSAKPDAEVLGEVKSAPVAELVDTVLQRSDNVLAETLIREVALATGQEPSFAGATGAVISVLRDNGFPVDDLVLRDGSGLSTQNKATAAVLAEVLRVAAAPDGADPRTAKLRPLLGGLPVAGGSGTLAGRYQEGAATAGRGWVRAKTGTLPSVRANSLAGVVLDKDGRLLVFALMSDGPDTLAARAALDGVAAALRKCGCR